MVGKDDWRGCWVVYDKETRYATSIVSAYTEADEFFIGWSLILFCAEIFCASLPTLDIHDERSQLVKSWKNATSRNQRCSAIPLERVCGKETRQSILLFGLFWMLLDIRSVLHGIKNGRRSSKSVIRKLLFCLSLSSGTIWREGRAWGLFFKDGLRDATTFQTFASLRLESEAPLWTDHSSNLFRRSGWYPQTSILLAYARSAHVLEGWFAAEYLIR